MTAKDLVRLIHRRHEGPAWQVFTELANGTGAKASRRADVVAMGMYPSRGMEIHGYECKVSRGDVRKELVDVGKMDAVGKYCDFWWLAIADESIIDGLIIPDGWGILVPRAKVLRLKRAAQKRKTVPVDRAFVAAMVRSVTDGYVPRARHDEVVDGHKADVAKAIADDRLYQGGDVARRELENLRQKIEEFEKASGVKVMDGWKQENVGAAVAAVLDAMGLLKGTHYLEGQVKALADLSKSAREHANAIHALVDAFAAPTKPPG